MDPQTPRPKSAARSPGLWLLVLAAALILAAALLWRREKAPAAPAASASTAPTAAVTGTYRNRSVRSAGPAAEAALPDAGAPAEVPSISGTVYDMSGSAVAGATVLATTFELAGNIPTVVGTAESDGAGRFELRLHDGTYQINVTRSGYGPTSITAHSGETMSVVLPFSGLVMGHVHDASKMPVTHFSIDVISVVPGDIPAPPPVWSKTFDSPDGSYEVDQLPAWPVVVRASADGYAPTFSPIITAVGPGKTREIDLTLPRGCVLTGVVVDSGGHPLPGVYVDAEARLVAGSMSDASAQTANQATTGPDGSFQLDHVPPAKVVVRAYDSDHAVTTMEVDAKDCAVTSPVRVVMSDGGAIEGVARDENGEPLAGAQMSLIDRSVGFVTTATDRDGHFRFENIPAGPMRLELLRGTQITLLFVTVKEGEVTTQDIALVPAGQGGLRGRITVGGKPMGGAQLLVASNRGPAHGIGIYHPMTAEDGSYSVPSLPEGVYLVSVMSTNQGGGTQVRAGEVTTFDLAVGAAPTGATP